MGLLAHSPARLTGCRRSRGGSGSATETRRSPSRPTSRSPSGAARTNANAWRRAPLDRYWTGPSEDPASLVSGVSEPRVEVRGEWPATRVEVSFRIRTSRTGGCGALSGSSTPQDGSRRLRTHRCTSWRTSPRADSRQPERRSTACWTSDAVHQPGATNRGRDEQPRERRDVASIRSSGRVAVPAARKGGCGVPGGGNTSTLGHVPRMGDTKSGILRKRCADLAVALRNPAASTRRAVGRNHRRSSYPRSSVAA